MRSINCKRINQHGICLDNRMTKAWHLMKPRCIELVSPMKKCEIAERHKKPKPPPAPPKHSPDFSWTGVPDKICRICKKEIKGTILVYLHEPYHGNCMYPGP